MSSYLAARRIGQPLRWGGQAFGAVVEHYESIETADLVGADLWGWSAWRRFEVMGGLADTRDDAVLAVCHFLDPADDLMLVDRYLPALVLAEFTAEQAERAA